MKISGRALSATIAMTISTMAAAQQRIWTLSGGSVDWYTMDSFGDYDGDGSLDIKTGAVLTSVPWPNGSSEILSGRTGARLHQRTGSVGVVNIDLGDIDGDGMRDYTEDAFTPNVGMRRVNITSFATGQPLWFVEGSYPIFAWLGRNTTLMEGNIDLTGDGRPDFLAITSHGSESDVYAFSNTGALLYQIPARAYGFIAINVTAMPDLDGDGGQEFLVGCLEYTGRGAVVVVSGRTGQIARISYGLHVGDMLGGAVCNAGDVDQDGMADYAAASYGTSPLLSIVIFSGRTGAVIRSWDDYWTWSGSMMGDIDVDLDGIPDLLAGSAYELSGQVRAYSGRDGTVLWNMNAIQGVEAVWATHMTNLGVQPGSPYPVFAFRDDWYYQSSPPYSRGRVIAVRTNLPGTGPVSGTPCSSTGQLPQIGMRQIPGGSRITIAKAPPGALAWLAGGPANQTAYGSMLLPASLAPIGLPACTAYVAPVVMAPTVIGTAGLDRGYAAIDLPWLLSTTGTALAAQWLMMDPTTGDFAVTARHDFRVP